jgi:N-acetylglucosaminyl-diphospho-decaprenol L-rhamnosyltransferase
MISTVVVTHDSAACVAGCLASLQGALSPAEIIVVDNRSSDETLHIVKATAPQARVLANADNLGFGRACNAGAKAARGSHVLFLNPDVFVTAIQRNRLCELLAEKPFGLVAPALEGETDRRRAERSWRGEYLAQTIETIRPREWRRRAGRYRPSQRRWVSGALLLVSRDEFLNLGGFDPRFFLYYEDLDLSRRYRNANLPIRTTEALWGHHDVGTSSASDGLRAAPMAWSLLGWLQYIYIHEGERKARRAAYATLTTLRALRRATQTLALLPWERARRKTQQLDELCALLANHAANDDADFCPEARRIIRGLT